LAAKIDYTDSAGLLILCRLLNLLRCLKIR
jgi:hypothetical protein